MDNYANAWNAYAGSLSTNTAPRPETVLESVVSRLGLSVARINSASDRANGIANTLIGFAGEEQKEGGPSSVPSSVADYLSEIDGALKRLEYHLGRLG